MNTFVDDGIAINLDKVNAIKKDVDLDETNDLAEIVTYNVLFENGMKITISKEQYRNLMDYLNSVKSN